MWVLGSSDLPIIPPPRKTKSSDMKMETAKKYEEDELFQKVSENENTKSDDETFEEIMNSFHHNVKRLFFLKISSKSESFVVQIEILCIRVRDSKFEILGLRKFSKKFSNFTKIQILPKSQNFIQNKTFHHTNFVGSRSARASTPIPNSCARAKIFRHNNRQKLQTNHSARF